MGAAAGLPLGLSIASAGLGAVSKGIAASGTASADQYKAEQLDEAAQYGELKASQTSGQMTRNLSMTLGHIDAVRGAMHADPNSPTGVAVRDYTEAVGTQQKDITVDSITAQAKMDESNAAYLRDASSKALLGGDLGIAGSLLSAASPLMKGGGGGMPSINIPGFNPIAGVSGQ